MNKHLKYLRYVLKHKYYVAVFLLNIKITPGNIWRAIIHDWTKFLPCEWFPYVWMFYGNCPEAGSDEVRVANQLGIGVKTKGEAKSDFDYAWLHHQKANKHHWQYWVLLKDDGTIKALNMPQKYIQEMVADWKSAGYCITGKIDIINWYEKNKSNIHLTETTRAYVENLIYGFQI